MTPVPTPHHWRRCSRVPCRAPVAWWWLWFVTDSHVVIDLILTCPLASATFILWKRKLRRRVVEGLARVMWLIVGDIRICPGAHALRGLTFHWLSPCLFSCLHASKAGGGGWGERWREIVSFYGTCSGLCYGQWRPLVHCCLESWLSHWCWVHWLPLLAPFLLFCTGF